MALLASHLEQISASSKSIEQLQFPSPRIFTNAILGDHEITTLIRDTEPHEQALFSVDQTAVTKSSRPSTARVLGEDNPLYGRKSLFPASQPSKQSIITRLLGQEMLQEIRKSTSSTSQVQNGVNVEVLLRGAEKLSEAYDVAGVSEKIRSLRKRHQEAASGVTALERKVAKQQSSLDRRNQGQDVDDMDVEPDVQASTGIMGEVASFTPEDILAEEEEIKELEARKKALENRVSGMERDLGGLR
ncbi:hypothetical protein B0A52_00755 [Exophiala mesophila]|uniref:DASH complex subunit SPC34 n=1 Tax=Exophiala mesophila TaxID=212818 RepID=A0A438NI49_EXOME|nr:hypothetical protein B0A52_00755 [Exophiala mesophila]